MSEPSTDDLLELARTGEDISQEVGVGPAIGGQQIVRGGLANHKPIGHPRRYCMTHERFLAAEAICMFDSCAVIDLTVEQWEALGADYFNRLNEALHATRLDKHLQWGPNLWRPIPGYPTYELNGFTREVRRRAHDKTLKSGVVRHYPARPVTARDSSVTLSSDGKPTSHGIEKLWRLTFSEYVADENSWQTHEMRHDSIPAELGRVVENGW